MKKLNELRSLLAILMKQYFYKRETKELFLHEALLSINSMTVVELIDQINNSLLFFNCELITIDEAIKIIIEIKQRTKQ